MATARFSPRIASACNVVLGSLAVVCLGVVAYVAVEADRFLTEPRPAAFFVGMPLLVGAVCVAGMRSRADRRLKLVLLFFSTGVSLFAVELYLFGLESYRVWAGRAAHAAAIEALRLADDDYDDRTTRELFIENWQSGEERIYPRIYQLSRRTVPVDGGSVFPTSSLSDRKIVECFADGRYKIYRADEYGFANPRGIHGGPAKLVLVGDSFTAGECVTVEEDIAARIRTVHPATVNLGIGGSGPLWQLANLVEYGLPLEPEHVFWLYYEGNDFGDLEYEMLFAELTHYLAGLSQELRGRKQAVDQQVADLQRREIEALTLEGAAPEADRELLRDLVRSFKLARIRTRLGFHSDSTEQFNGLIEMLERIIVRGKDLVEGSGSRFTFVYVPDYTRFVGGDDDFHRSRVLEILRQNGVALVDLLPELEGHPDPLSLYPHRQMGHFNPAGYALIANRLLDEVSRE